MLTFFVIPTVGGEPMRDEWKIEDAESIDEVAGKYYGNAIIIVAHRYGPRPDDDVG